jgi:hypothetical protein
MQYKPVQIARYILALLLAVEGTYYALGILSALYLKHLLVLDPRILLIFLGVAFLKDGQSVNRLVIGYTILALSATVLLKLDLILLIPRYTNILYVLGLLSERRYSNEETTIFATIFICYRLFQVCLATGIVTTNKASRIEKEQAI